MTLRFTFLLALLTAFFTGSRFCAAGDERGGVLSSSAGIDYGEPKSLCKLAAPAISESSGIACSRRSEGVFWTHNDSGGAPRIHAFNREGEDLGSFDLEGAKAVDWEDMASFRIGEQCYLLLADTGNNLLKREQYTLYVVKEPRLSPGGKPPRGKIAVERTIHFRCADGVNNFESVAVDPKSETIYLASKSLWPISKFYELPLPRRDQKSIVTAKLVAQVRILFPTAMDISPDSQRLMLLTYGCAFEFTRRGEETWAQTLARIPRAVVTPENDQAEGICYGRDGETLFLTSEGVSSPLWEVPVKKASEESE